MPHRVRDTYSPAKTRENLMPDLADLFPGYASEWIHTKSGRIFARVGGNGPPLLLLHGFPQTHVCWSRIAHRLGERFTVVLADLTGYGDSTGPPVDDDGGNYAKRIVAGHMVALMRALGHEPFCLAGHDR